ncbi:MAG: lysophospholipase [Terrimicrobiaceae bacterium]|nr:lysophospholipase [Terrimicrobiaceae bacterium]
MISSSAWIVAAMAFWNPVEWVAEKAVGEALCPPLCEDPGQWKWFPAAREDFEVVAADGTVLRGWFTPVEGARGTVVILHGHRSCADHMAWFAQKVREAGMNAVVYDARAHGRSEGKVVGFGLWEADDARRVGEWAAARTGGPVALLGISMGAAVGAQALASPTPYRGGALLAPFSNLEEMAGRMVEAHFAGWVPGLREHVRQRMRDLLGADPSSVDVVKAARQIRVPVLVVHGAKDARIPIGQGRQVFDALSSPGSRWIELPQAGHDDLVSSREPWGPETLAEILGFLRSALGE